MAKTKALISFAVTAKLICVFVFAYANIQFSDVVACIVLGSLAHHGLLKCHDPRLTVTYFKEGSNSYYAYNWARCQVSIYMTTGPMVFKSQLYIECNK